MHNPTIPNEGEANKLLAKADHYVLIAAKRKAASEAATDPAVKAKLHREYLRKLRRGNEARAIGRRIEASIARMRAA